MSFSYNVKAELCRAAVQRLCCARAEAYGVLLYCNTFTPTEVRIITGNPAYAERLPRLFGKAFRIHFDRVPEETQGGKFILLRGGKKAGIKPASGPLCPAAQVLQMPQDLLSALRLLFPLSVLSGLQPSTAFSRVMFRSQALLL